MADDHEDDCEVDDTLDDARPLPRRIAVLALVLCPLPLTLLLSLGALILTDHIEQVYDELSIRLPEISARALDLGPTGLCLIGLLLVSLPMGIVLGFRRLDAGAMGALTGLALLNLLYCAALVVALLLPWIFIFEQLGNSA